MDTLEIVIAVAASVILFLFGIEHFSREVQAISGARFRKFLATATRNRMIGFVLGGGLTAIIQSSTATSVIAVGLVNAGVLSFRHSLGVLFGANVGTTVTAQLVAFKLTSFAPLLILTGFVAGYVPFRWRILGRSIFYFGIVFFSLNLVSSAVEPLRTNSAVIETLASVHSPIAAVLAGALFTAIVQSSTVTTGIAIILIDQGIVPFGTALPLIFGANIGTTITALIAAASLDTSARRTAASHALYNIGGVLLFLPLLHPFSALLARLELSPAATLATAHFLFNAITAVVFLSLLAPFARLVERLVKDEAGEETVESPPPAPETPEEDPSLMALRTWLQGIVGKLSRCYIAAVLSLETRDKKIESRANRIASIVLFALEEGRDTIHQISSQSLTAEQSHALLRIVVTMDHIRQITDSIEDIMVINKHLERRNMRLSMDALLDVQAVYPRTAKLLGRLERAFDAAAEVLPEIQRDERALAEVLGECYLRFIEFSKREQEGSELADFLSIHQRLRSKILAFAEHLRAPSIPAPDELSGQATG